MNPRRCPGVFGGVVVTIALAGCATQQATNVPTYFEASAGEPAPAAGNRALPSYSDSAARYGMLVGSMPGPEVRFDVTAEALDDLANAVAALPGAANGPSGEAIRAHAQELRRDANDAAAARHDVGLALAVAANAFDAVARITYPNDVTLARSVADVRTDIYPVVTDETQADRADVYRALTGMARVLRAYETVATAGG